MPRRSPRPQLTATIALVAIVGSLFVGCNRLPSPPSFAMDPDLSATEDTVRVVPVDVWVDDSASMEGFVRPIESRYKSAVSLLVEKLVTAGVRHSVSPLSSMARTGSRATTVSRRLLAPDFYRAGETPLATLLTAVSPRIRDGRLLVIVSDLIQSEKGRSPHQFIEALASAAGSDVLLVGFRSAFRGRYFVESEPRTQNVIPLELDGAAFARSRPFYFLVFAPSRAGLTQFRKQVLDDLKPDEEFYASEPPITVTKTDVVAEGHFGLRGPVESLAGPGPFVGSFLERQRPTGDMVDLRLRVTGLQKLGIVSPEGFRYEVGRLDEKTGQWAPVRIVAGATVAREPLSPPSVSFVVSYRLPRVPPYRWDVYRVRIRPGPANVSAPRWIAQWSTRDDRVAELGYRTLHLNLIGEALIRAITEEKVIMEHYLKLARKS